MDIKDILGALNEAYMAKDLLYSVWVYIDPYSGKAEIDADTLKKLREYFEFDDGE